MITEENMLDLMYITNDPEAALIAESAGVNRIFVDMEYMGKEARQKGLDTVKNHHTVRDVKNLRKVLTDALLLARVNPLHHHSKSEIDEVIAAGADIVMLPMWMNFLIRTYSWMTILGDTGIINTFLNAIGLGSVQLINTGAAVILGMVYNFLPYMILPIYSVLSKMDNSLIEAAQDLGSNRVQIIKKVIMPLSLPGVLSGITMVFVPCVSTFYITQKLGGGQVVLIGDIIETQFQSANNYNLGASLSLVLMVLILICLGVMNYLGADSETEGGVVI